MSKEQKLEQRILCMVAYEELKKCKENPYYFATKYLYILNNDSDKVPFTTMLTEEEFNKMIKEWL